MLLYKRLEEGNFHWPRSGDEVRQLTWQQYCWLVEGLQIDQPKSLKEVVALSVV
ncbi:hypothetical protein B5F52_13995 [Flavonifractor plautii]|nr:hypothetical protein B5F52_13995 [Flavonifractor plautii]